MRMVGGVSYPLSWFERSPSAQAFAFAYSLHDLQYLICSKMATDLLENVHMCLAKNRFSQNSNSQLSKLFIFIQVLLKRIPIDVWLY